MTKIDIISGFLGAGKTTLIKKIISEGYVGEKIVLIENEFGEIGIDGGFLKDVKVETYLLEGDKDLLFPFQKSIDNANKHISFLKEVKVFDNVGHGIETYEKAMNYIGQKISKKEHTGLN